MERAGANEKLLLDIADDAQNEDVDLAISTATDAVKVKSEAQSNFVLGRALKLKALIESLRSGEVQTELLERAKAVLQLTLKQSRSPSGDMYYDLGDVLEDLGSYADAESSFLQALEASKRSFSQSAFEGSLRGLARVTYAQKRSAESEAWFKKLTDGNLANAWDWNAEARRRFDLGKYTESGDGYNTALRLGGDWKNSCYAALSYGVSQNKDAGLSAARQCISVGTGKDDSVPAIASAHFIIADVLNGRGVFAEALNHAREAVDLDPTDAWYFQAEAEALVGLRRFQEAITASNQAIRLSDGKYSSMHFTLGSAYFGQENWEFARQSYEKAADLESTDTAAPYNVALCFARLGYKTDAAKWYAEVLRRNPNHPDRAEIRRDIAILTGGT